MGFHWIWFYLTYLLMMWMSIQRLPSRFADERKLGRTAKILEDKNRVPKNLSRMESWVRDTKINFNSEKCQVLHLGKMIKSTNTE